MQQEKIPHVRPSQQNGAAISLQADAPIETDGVTRNGKRTQPEREDIDGHVESSLNFKSTDFRIAVRPGKTSSAQMIDGQCRMQMRRVSIRAINGRRDFGKGE